MDFTARAGELSRRSLSTLQINVGKLCNQACLHCHVEAGPKRTEMMDGRTATRLMELMAADARHIGTVDITGGAPEMNAHFRPLVLHARKLGIGVIDRCNLTVLHLDGQHDTVAFLAANQVEVSASLPCYSSSNVEKQRGKGVFAQSIRALQHLNAHGYGRDPALVLHLVYNPGGAFLPPAQPGLEADYKRRLSQDFGVVFNRLLTITNMPIKRFRKDLEWSGGLNQYMRLLGDNFNADTVPNLMCRDQISVSWDGRLFDCDFNQMLEIPVPGAMRTIWDVESLLSLNKETIAVADHCFGCTAGAGSSCGGALAAK